MPTCKLDKLICIQELNWLSTSETNQRKCTPRLGRICTAACLLRRSFRNWFQPHFPYIYATFRCVEN